MSETISESTNIEIYAQNLGVTQEIATRLAQLVPAGTIILLEGNLGSGKTTFMQAFGRASALVRQLLAPLLRSLMNIQRDVCPSITLISIA